MLQHQQTQHEEINKRKAGNSRFPIGLVLELRRKPEIPDLYGPPPIQKQVSEFQVAVNSV